MTLRSIAYLKEKFETGDVPTQADFIDLIDSLLHYTKLAVANGVATLDATGKVPLTQIPSSIIGGLQSIGFWDVVANEIVSDDFGGILNGEPLPMADVDNKSWFLIANTSAVFTRADFIGSPVTINAGDAIISSGNAWSVISNFQLIQSVNGQTGIVVLDKTDIGLSNVPNVDATLRANHTGTQAQSTIVGLVADLLAKEDVGVAQSLITALKDGVSVSGDTLQKLYNLIISMSAPEVTVANIAARDAYNVTSLPFNIFVTDDGDSKWAYYKATTTGVGATFIKLSDQDTQHAVMSAASIKASYESNSDTNAYTNAEKSKLAGIATGATANDTDANLKNRANHTGTQAISTVTGLQTALDLVNKGSLSFNLKGSLSSGMSALISSLVSGGTITSWTIEGEEASGSIVVDLQRWNGSSYVSIIGAGNKPTISSAKNATASVSSWTSTTLSVNDRLRFVVDSVSSFSEVNLQIKYTKS